MNFRLCSCHGNKIYIWNVLWTICKHKTNHICKTLSSIWYGGFTSLFFRQFFYGLKFLGLIFTCKKIFEIWNSVNADVMYVCREKILAGPPPMAKIFFIDHRPGKQTAFTDFWYFQKKIFWVTWGHQEKFSGFGYFLPARPGPGPKAHPVPTVIFLDQFCLLFPTVHNSAL